MTVRFVRLGAISLLALCTAIFYSWTDYKAYWWETLSRLQTIDFNMLSHTLPAKLSYALLQENSDEIQQTLDSNYGLFRLVVTNCQIVEKECPEQSVLFASQSDKMEKAKLELSDISQFPYDVLRNPPPVVAEWKYDRPLSWERNSTGKTNSGEIIGRVYYIRNLPPHFLKDYWDWLKNYPNNRGDRKNYSLIMAFCLATGFSIWTVIEFLLDREHKRQAQLQKEIVIIGNELREKQRQNYLLESERSQFSKSLLETQIALAQINLKKQLLQEIVLGLTAKQEADRQEILEGKRLLAEEKNKLNSAKEIAFETQQKLLQLQRERAAANQQITQLELQLKEIQLAWKEDVHKFAQVESQKQKLQKQLVRAEQLVNELQEKQTELEEQKAIWQNETSLLKTEIKRIEGELYQESITKKRSQQRIESLERQMEKYETQEMVDNDFEKEVRKCLKVKPLKGGTDTWITLANFENSPKNHASQFIDLVVILNEYCVVVIEAKNYRGKIQADGDVKNNPWFCYNSAGKILIQSAGLTNPYHQVAKYVKNIGIKLDNFTRKTGNRPIPVYGVIVFPQNSDISKVESELSNYYRVTTLNCLVKNLETIEEKVKKGSKSYQYHQWPLSARRIEDLLRGRLHT